MLKQQLGFWLLNLEASGDEVTVSREKSHATPPLKSNDDWENRAVAAFTKASFHTAYSSVGGRSATGEGRDCRRQMRYSDLVSDRGLVLPPSKELNWSGKGQHVEFGITEDIPLKPLAAMGRGGLALVNSVLCRRIKLARKIITCSREQRLETIINEVEHLHRLKHPHIIQLVGSYLQGKEFAILLYPVAQWNLSCFLERCQGVGSASPELQVLPRFFRCISHALAYIHGNNMKHMDLKPQNVLVRVNKNRSPGPKAFPPSALPPFAASSIAAPSIALQFNVYLADFGISKKFAADELSQTDGNTALSKKYCAPEVYEGELRGGAADVFSLGCVFLEIATVIQGVDLDELVDFFSSNTSQDRDEEPYHEALEKVAAWISHLQRVPASGLEWRKDMTIKQKVISRMLSKDPTERPVASIVLKEMGGARVCCLAEPEPFEIE